MTEYNKKFRFPIQFRFIISITVMIASKYKANYCHYACFPPEIRKIMSKSGSWINNHLFTYTPYTAMPITTKFLHGIAHDRAFVGAHDFPQQIQHSGRRPY